MIGAGVFANIQKGQDRGNSCRLPETNLTGQVSVQKCPIGKRLKYEGNCIVGARRTPATIKM
jgi:hypothetical protein